MSPPVPRTLSGFRSTSDGGPAEPRLLVTELNTGEFVPDQLCRLAADARERVELISVSPKPVQGRDALSAQSLPGLERQAQPP
jgi:hypothetical protein